MGIKNHTALLTAALALGLFFAPVFITSPAMAQPAALTKKQSDALDAYNKAVGDFEQILRQRRAQISSHQGLPNLPGQAIYLARINMMSTYKDLTDDLPSKIGAPNKFGIPPAYFEASKEPLLDEYRAIFDLLEAPPANAQKSDTPFKDVVDLASRHCAGEGAGCGECRSGGTYQPGAVLCRNQRQSECRQRPLEQIQGQFSNRPLRRPDRPQEVGGDKNLDRGLRSGA